MFFKKCFHQEQFHRARKCTPLMHIYALNEQTQHTVKSGMQDSKGLFVTCSLSVCSEMQSGMYLRQCLKRRVCKKRRGEKKACNVEHYSHVHVAQMLNKSHHNNRNKTLPEAHSEVLKVKLLLGGKATIHTLLLYEKM